MTRAGSYMGPAIVDLFAAEGAEVLADDGDLTDPGAAASLVERAGDLDAVVVNLEAPATVVRASEVTDAAWQDAFELLVHPTMRLVRAALPAMVERGRGKIVVVTSAVPLRPVAPVLAYAVARGAQNTLVQQVGVEVAHHGVNVNAIAQNFVENPDYFPPGVLEDPAMAEWISRTNPAGRLATGAESAELALFLVSDRSDFFFGQVVPFAGGSAVNV